MFLLLVSVIEIKKKKTHSWVVVVVHVINPSTQETEARGSL